MDIFGSVKIIIYYLLVQTVVFGFLSNYRSIHIKSNELIENAYDFNFASGNARNKSLLIVPKVFGRSINKTNIPPLSKALFHFSNMVLKERCLSCDF